MERRGGERKIVPGERGESGGGGEETRGKKDWDRREEGGRRRKERGQSLESRKGVRIGISKEGGEYKPREAVDGGRKRGLGTGRMGVVRRGKGVSRGSLLCGDMKRSQGSAWQGCPGGRSEMGGRGERNRRAEGHQGSAFRG